MVQAVDGRVGERGEAGVDGCGWVVKHGVEVRFAREPEAGEALHCAVQDEICPVG